MKRLVVLALLLVPGSLRSLGAMAGQSPDGEPPAPVAARGERPAPPRPPAAPWFRPTGNDPASAEFRLGIRPAGARVEVPAPPAPPDPPCCDECEGDAEGPQATPPPPARHDERLRLFEVMVEKVSPALRDWIGHHRELVPIAGELSATEDRAQQSARAKLREAVAHWVGPEVPTSWHVPNDLADRLVADVRTEALDKDYGTVYQSTLLCDFSPIRRAQIVRAYESSVVAQRLGILGVGLALILALLAVVAGYIRADEATRGYYTNRLRLVAAAAVGAAGVAAYRLLG